MPFCLFFLLLRRVYWTDVGKLPKIESSNLDGSHRRVVVNNDLGAPNYVVVDYRRQAICWSDSKLERAECMSLHLRSRRTVLSLQGNIFGLSIFQVILSVFLEENIMGFNLYQ